MRKESLYGQAIRVSGYGLAFFIVLVFILLSSAFVLADEVVPRTQPSANPNASVRKKIESFCAKCIADPIISVRLVIRSQKNPATNREEDSYLVNDNFGFGVDCQTGIITSYGLYEKAQDIGDGAADTQSDCHRKNLTEKDIFEGITPFLVAFGLPSNFTEFERADSKYKPDAAVFYYRYKYNGVVCLGCYAIVDASLKTGKVLSIRSVPIFAPPQQPQQTVAPCDAVEAASKWFKNCAETRKSKYRITLTVKDCKQVEKVIAPHGGLLDNKDGGRTDLAYCWAVPFELLEYYTDSWHGPWPCDAYVSCSTGKVIGDSIGPPIQQEKQGR